MDGSIVFAMQHQCAPNLTHASSGKRHLDRFSRFCTAHGRMFLYFTIGPPLPPENCPFMGIWVQSNTWFLGPTRIYNPNGISIGLANFAELTVMKDRQTDRQTDRPTDRQTTLLRL